MTTGPAKASVAQDETRRAEIRIDAPAILDVVVEPMLLLGAGLKVLAANAAFHTAFGLPTGDTLGRALPNLPHSLFGHAGLIEMVRRAAQGGASDEVAVFDASQQGGGMRSWRAAARRAAADFAEPVTILALHDVTDERRVVRRQLQFIIDASPVAMFTVDIHGRILSVNKAMTALFGYEDDELVGQRIEILLPPGAQARHRNLMAAYLANRVARPMAAGLDIKGIARDGAEIPLDIGLSPLPTARGPLVLATAHDLRAEKQIQRNLAEAKAEAERANVSKSRFLAAASHDLRQPLQSIGLLVGALERRSLDIEAREALRQVEEAVSGMAVLLDTLLDVNQIESGVIRPSIGEFPVGDALSASVAGFADLAAAKGVQLKLAPSTAIIRSDRNLLMRIVSNLVSNAVKYTDRGKILVGCRRRGGLMRIEVWDTGVGIPEHQLKSVFGEFYRVNPSDGAKSGLGLGLYIVQRFAELLDHRVEVRSRPGKGAVFSVSVPFVNTGALAGEAGGDGAHVPHILAVEDAPVQLSALRALLKLEGYDVSCARGRDEVLALIRARGRRPDLILSDFSLSDGSNGVEVIRLARREFRAQIPALIMTGISSAAVRQTIEDSGVGCIAKPVNANDLIARIESLLEPGRAARLDRPKPPASSIGPRDGPDGADIGVVDDERGVREATRAMLESTGRRVATFPSAEALLADPVRTRLRCIVADISLPGMDGIALHRRLKAEKIETPLVFLTGRGELPLAIEAMKGGAADFLQKPVAAADLVASVARALNIGAESAEADSAREDVETRLATLTPRERQVVKGVLAGMATKAVAAELGVSVRTAEHHRQNAMHKMGARTLAMLFHMVAHRLDEF